MKKLNQILVISTSYPRNDKDDAGIFVARLVEALATQTSQNNIEVGIKVGIKVIVPWDNQENKTETRAGVQIIRCSYSLFLKGNLAFGSGILSNIKAKPWVLLQIPGLIFSLARTTLKNRDKHTVILANWAISGLVAWLCHLFTSTPYLTVLRGQDIHLLKSKMTRWVFLPSLRSAKKIITVNQEFKSFLVEALKIDANKVCPIYNGVESTSRNEQLQTKILNDLQIPTDLPLIIFVGRLIPLKRCELAILLMAQLKSFRLLLVGRALSDSYLNSLKQLATDLGVSERCIFTGAIDPANIPHLLHSSRYFISASESEGRPNSLLEAMAEGSLVLCSNISAHNEIVQHKKTAILFEPEDINSSNKLADNILELENNSELYKSICNEARNYTSQFSWENTAKSYLELL